MRLHAGNIEVCVNTRILAAGRVRRNGFAAQAGAELAGTNGYGGRQRASRRFGSATAYYKQLADRGGRRLSLVQRLDRAAEASIALGTKRVPLSSSSWERLSSSTLVRSRGWRRTLGSPRRRRLYREKDSRAFFWDDE